MTAAWALTWLGQCAALAALTAAFVRLPVCRASAAARQVAWALALFSCAGLLAWPLVGAAAAGPALVPALGAAGTQAPSAPVVVLPAPFIRMTPALGWVWAFGTALGLAWCARDVRRVLRMKRGTLPLNAAEQARLGLDPSAWKALRAPRLAWCDELDCPAVLGFRRPVIALPRAQVAALSAAQVRLVVLHELAHVRRGDDWWALAHRVVLALTWVNPVVHLVQRELSLAREMACDEFVVRQSAAPLAYAKCLADVAGMRTSSRRLQLASSVIGGPGALRRRIVGVLALDGRPAARAVALAAWLSPALVCVAAAWLLQVPPVFVAEFQPDAAAPARASSGPAATVEPTSAGPAVLQWTAGKPPGDGRRPDVSRRTPEPGGERAGAPASIESASLAPPVMDVGSAQAESAGREPLAARDLPGVGTAGVTAAAIVPEAPVSRPGAPRWWSGPAAVGEATGVAAAAAGRATASFVTGLGTHAPQLLKR